MPESGDEGIDVGGAHHWHRLGVNVSTSTFRSSWHPNSGNTIIAAAVRYANERMPIALRMVWLS